MRMLILFMIATAGCTDDPGKFYSYAPAGSRWQFDFGAGVPANADFTGTCPTLMSRTVELTPTVHGSAPCDPGCTCALDMMFGDNDGLFTETQYVLFDYRQDCDDGSRFAMSDYLVTYPTAKLTMWWTAPTTVPGHADACMYPTTSTATLGK